MPNDLAVNYARDMGERLISISRSIGSNDLARLVAEAAGLEHEARALRQLGQCMLSASVVRQEQVAA
jgi:hypothetical protein